MQSLTSFRRCALAAAVSTTCMAGAANAAPLEEIIVTATAREARVQDIPYNISAVLGDDIANNQMADQAELMRAVAGVAVVDRGNRNSGVINGIMIRGLNVDGSALGDYALAASPTVSTYIDHTPVYANFVLKDLQRVEVLRGPQGTLYGAGSLGGTVRYITNKPSTDGFEGIVNAGSSVTEASDGYNLFGDAVVNIPLSDTLAVRAGVGTIDADGLTDYVNVYELDANGIPVAPNGVLDPAAEYRSVKDADDVNIDYGKIALLWRPSDRVEIVATYITQEDDIGGRRQQTPGTDGFGNPYDDNEIGSVQLEPSSREVDLAMLEMEFDLGFATLTSATSDYEHTGDSVSENTGFYAQNGWLGGFYYNYPRPMASAVRQYEDSAFIQELRLVSSGGGSFDWVAGVFYMDQDTYGAQQSYLRGFKNWFDAFAPGVVASDQDWDYSRDDNYEELAFYGELTWHMDALHVTLGARYFENDYQSSVFQDYPLYGSCLDDASFLPCLNQDNSTDDQGLLGKLNIAYDLSDESLAYLTVSQGYRRGGSNAVPTDGTFAEDPGWGSYDPDEVINYEIGVKGNRGGLYYSATAFYVDWQDVQVNTATYNWGFFAVTNGDSASTAGLELELKGNIDERWSWGLGYTYVDAQLEDDLSAPGYPFIIASDGNELPGTSEHSVNAAIDYLAPLGGTGLNLFFRAAAYYQSETWNAVNDSPTYRVELDDFAIFDGHVGISGDWWTGTLFVKNITDEDGTTGTFTQAYMGSDPTQGYYGNGAKNFLALPRTVGLNFRFNF